MASYVDFINSMLNLREQKLKEEQLQAEAERKEIEAITSSISSLGSSIGSAVSSYSQNSAANRLMNQATPPRAEAVMPGTTTPNVALNKSAAAAPLEGQIPYDQIPVTTGPATGGKAELEMRLKMDAEARRRMIGTIEANQKERALTTSGRNADTAENNSILAQQREQRLIDQEIENKKVSDSQKLVDDHKAKFAASTDQFKGYQKDADAFNAATALSLDAVSKATTQADYVKALGFLDSHYKAAEKMGLKVEKPPIASWEETQAVKAKQAAIAEATTASTTWDFNPYNNPAPGQIANMQKELEGLPGYNKYGPGNVPVIEQGRDKLVVEPNYLAVPAMERPVVPDYQAIRSGATGQPAPTGQGAAPVTGTTATGGGGQTITMDEAKAMGIPNPVSKQWYKSKTRGYVQVQ